jgi:glucosamine-6-phosphate deaminase
MLATGNSQLAFLAELVKVGDIDWDRVTAFHMDEYVGLPPTHTASFQHYMRELVAAQLPFREFNYLSGDTGDADAEARRYEDLLRRHPLDLCCAGIGENGHLAFNDPPVADFDDLVALKVVRLDDACRRQQVGEGHFPDVDAVPATAITVTIPALLRAARVMVVAPDARKAAPVAAAFRGPVTTACPASVLQTVSHATVYLEPASAAGLPSHA